MAINFRCPECKKALSAKDELAGRKAACTGCKKTLTIPGGSRKSQAPGSPANGAPPAPTLTPEEAEAAAAALLADGAGPAPGEAVTIDFTCEYCDAAISAPTAEAGKRMPCPECKKILKVPAAAKPDVSNWRRADRHLPSAAKAPDEPAPEGAWGNLTRSVVSREALEEADAIPDTPEPVTLRERIYYWGTIAVGLTCVSLLGMAAYNHFAADRTRRALDSATTYAAEAKTLKIYGPERVGALHTLAGTYFIRTRVPYSDSPVAPENGAGENARDEFDRGLKALQDADKNSPGRDAALGDLALAMVELGGDKDEQREKLRTTWEECLRRVRAALSGIQDPGAKLEAYRAVARRLFERDQAQAALALASTAFSESPAEKMSARALGLQMLLEDKPGDRPVVAKGCDELLKEYAAKEPPPLVPEVVTLAMVMDLPAPAPGKSASDKDNAWIGEAEGYARKGRLPEGQKKADDAKNVRVKLHSLVAVGSATPQGAGALSSACKVALDGIPSPERESWILLRLVRLGHRANLPTDLLQKVADTIADPSVRGRAKLELFRARLEQMKELAATEPADTVDLQTAAGGLARADLARHNVKFDSGYLRTAESWPEPLNAFGTFGALLGGQKDGP
jgi:hypothetical protein